MWLFDNIFLDKDTPTALLDNPEIKPPDGTPKKEEANVPYDPKNDPIAPPVDAIGEWIPWSAEWVDATDVSFDIWGDLDFSVIGSAETPEEWNGEIKGDGLTADAVWETWNTETTDGIDSWISSIAMIQWGTASVVDGIDIWWMATTPDQWVSLEIHDIEDPQNTDTSSTENGAGGIYGFMDQSLSPTTDSLSWATPEAIPDAIAKEEAVIDALPIEEHPIESSISILDTDSIIQYPVRSQRGGKIQELIEKLITELYTLDEEEQKIEAERQSKIDSIAKRENELEHEYATRKEALRYERSSLELPADKSLEKNRIKSLISSFQEDLG